MFMLGSLESHRLSAGAPPQTRLGELTALPQTPSLDFRGLLQRGGGRERKGGEARKGQEGKRGREGQGGR